jgi:hypothetical protein
MLKVQELREKEEALEWLLKHRNYEDFLKQKNCPPYLQKRLGKEGE